MVIRAGLEPSIAALKGLCPYLLDERTILVGQVEFEPTVFLMSPRKELRLHYPVRVWKTARQTSHITSATLLLLLKYSQKRGSISQAALIHLISGSSALTTWAVGNSSIPSLTDSESSAHPVKDSVRMVRVTSVLRHSVLTRILLRLASSLKLCNNKNISLKRLPSTAAFFCPIIRNKPLL